MTDLLFTDEELMALLAKGHTQLQASKILNCHASTVERRLVKLRRQGYDTKSGGYDTKVPDGFKLKGRSIMRDSAGKVILQWEKSTIDEQRQNEIIKEMCKALVKDLPKETPTTSYNEHEIDSDLMAVYPLGDPHIGMLSWDKETEENWDLAIAQQVFINMFVRVVKAAPKCKKALIVNLGDLFHRNNSIGTTDRSGHHLDCDGRFAKMVQIGVLIIRKMIETALSYHEEVEIWNIPGNHDDTTSMFLAIALKHIYENEPRVIVNDSPALFQYYRFGKNLIGAHHGHTCKMIKLPSVMACDRSKEWGETEFRYWLTGHIHHDSKIEAPGCMVESFRTLAAKDNYAMSGGWRSGRDTKVIIYHKEYGEVERHTINIAQFTANA
jgi:hypothetical protein